MWARMLSAGLVAISTVVISSPASAKPSVTEATITGPGIDGELTIERSDAATLWEYGISRADSITSPGSTPSDLEVGYLVTYTFRFRDDIRQDLYPYAQGGPVTYTPPHQELTGLFGERGYMRVTAGWYRSRTAGFLGYLVDHGLPERDPVAPVATADAAPDSALGAEGLWTTILVVLGGSTALFLVSVARRRASATHPLSRAVGEEWEGPERRGRSGRSRGVMTARGPPVSPVRHRDAPTRRSWC